MDLARIRNYLDRVDEEDFSIGELADIDEAFRRLVDSGVGLRDDPDNATVGDQLLELEEHAPKIEKEIYNWLVKNFTPKAIEKMNWSTRSLADHLNQMPVIGDDNKLGFILGELDR